MKIGTIGLEFGSGNKGCEALGFSFLYMLNEIAKIKQEYIEVRIFLTCDIERIYRILECNNLRLSCASLGKITNIKNKIFEFKQCDIVYDFTAGDSFADIYGLKRFLKGTMNKQMVLWSGKPLLLGSQTYGPFKNQFTKKWAGHVIKKSKKIYARDMLSKKFAEQISGRNDIYQTVDVAFALPYNKLEYDLQERKKTKIGFNPSGLLWAGGYSRDNQFAMQIDYRKYCIDLIKKLIETDQYDIYLVPHVIYVDMSLADNDMVACRELNDIFSEICISPTFDTPMDAKSFISNLDVFIGARMHATIGAFSSGVATIPVSYSRKFEGLYDAFDYPYVISGTKVNTEEAIETTISYVRDWEKLRKTVQKSTHQMKMGVDYLMSSISEDLAKI